MPEPKYDAVARDMFSALDVGLLVPIAFMVDGLQEHKVKLRVAVVTCAIGIAVGINVGLFVGKTWGVLSWMIVMTAGWCVQVAIRFKLRQSDNVTARPATWLTTAVSPFHFITLINLYHSELHEDNLIRFARAWIYVIHVVAGTTLVFTTIVMEPLNTAWGCYPPTAKLRDYDFGPCGEDPSLPWVDPYPQAICRRDAYEVLSPGQTEPCGPRTSAIRLFGNVFHITIHMEMVAAAIYTIACLHAYSVFFSDDLALLKQDTKVTKSARLML